MLTNLLFRKTTLLFTCSFFVLNVQAQTSAKHKFRGSNVYAGIEIGSKGVKMSLIEVASAGSKNGNFNILKDTSTNTDFITFSKESFQNTLKGLTGLYTVAKKSYEIPAEKIFVVFSSGVKVVSERENKTSWLTSMSDSFKIAVNEPNRIIKPIEVIDEARLSHLGIVPEPKRYTTFLIDIGSGNTKGGYFPSGNTKNFNLFQLTWGTKSISNATDKRLDDDRTILNFYKQMQRVLSGQAEEEITYAVNVSGAYNMSDNIAFSGGIAWATANLMYPELAENQVVPVLYEDVLKLSERVFENYSSLSDSTILNTIQDSTLDKKYIGNEIRKVNKVFDQRALLSGIGLLLKIMRQFEGVYEKKQFYFIKNGQVGWISAFVNQTIAENK